MNRCVTAGIALATYVFSCSAASALDLQLQGKTALVTGSTSNIGYGIAKALLREGAQVIINARSPQDVQRAAASLKASTGREPLTFVGDMGKPEDIARLTRSFANVDILVNNVAVFDPKPFDQSTDQDWLDTFNVNVMSGVRLSRAYLPGMRQRNWGRVIFISSESALQIPLESIHYGVSKAAEVAVARGLAETLAGTGVTVNSVLPGPTQDPADPRLARAMGARASRMRRSSGNSSRRCGPRRSSSASNGPMKWPPWSSTSRVRFPPEPRARPCAWTVG